MAVKVAERAADLDTRSAEASDEEDRQMILVAGTGDVLLLFVVQFCFFLVGDIYSSYRCPVFSSVFNVILCSDGFS